MATYTANTGNIISIGEPTVDEKVNIETGTNCYPGRIAQRGTTDYDVVGNDGVHEPVGWIGYEGSHSRKDLTTTVYASGDTARLYRGGGFVIRAKLAIGTYALKGDVVVNWSDGCVASGIMLKNQFHLRVPFVNTTGTTLVDTGVDFVAGHVIGLPQIWSSVYSGASLEVGMGAGAQASFDVDGLVGPSAIALVAGFANHDLAVTTTATQTIGALLTEAELLDATPVTPVYTVMPLVPGRICNGTLTALDYTPSSHAMAGYIFVPVTSAGTHVVGMVEQTVSNSKTLTQDVYVRSII